MVAADKIAASALAGAAESDLHKGADGL